MPKGSLKSVGIVYSVIPPAVDMRPIWPASSSVNQILPSRPAVISAGLPLAGNSSLTPCVVIRPMTLTAGTGCAAPRKPGHPRVYHRFPSGPAAITPGPQEEGDRENSVSMPFTVIRPILLALVSVNQRLPSGPATIPHGELAGVGIGNSVIS